AVAARLWDALRLARAVGRCLQLGRQLEAQHAELVGTASTTGTTSTCTTISTTPSTASRGNSEDHRALVRCAHTLLALREVFAGSGSGGTPGAEGYGLVRVSAVRTLRDGVVTPNERAVRETAERLVREFSMMGVGGSSTGGGGSGSSAGSYALSQEVRARP